MQPTTVRRINVGWIRARDCESIIKNSLNRQIYKTNVWANAIRPYRININPLETVNIAHLN